MIKRSALPITFVLATLFALANSELVAQDKGELASETKQEVIDALIKEIGRVYLYPDRAANIEKKLRERLEAGGYEESKTSFTFAVKLTDDLRSITNDLHFAVRPGSGDGTRFGGFRLVGGGEEGAGDSASGGNGEQRSIRIGGSDGMQLDPDSEMFKALHEQFRKSNFSMPKLEVLPGNVGYMRLDMMPPLDVARPTLDAAMAFLSNTDAMVIDVRDTPGGVGGFIPYLMSYYFPEGGKLLFTRYFGAENRSDKFFTLDEIGGKRRPDTPLYVLTSSSTGSAAENLAFTLKNHGRATTVGETTRGGGHSATMVPLVDGFTASIPIADVIHPVTGAGFDGTGVTPNVEVAASDALAKAHEMALETLIENASEADKAGLVEILAEVRATRSLDQAVSDNTNSLEVYVGQYGNRTIFIEGGKLKYQREGGPALELKPLGDDTFRLNTPAGVRSAMALPNVRFERDDNNKIRGFSLVRDSEVEEYAEKEAK